MYDFRSLCTQPSIVLVGSLDNGDKFIATVVSPLSAGLILMLVIFQSLDDLSFFGLYWMLVLLDSFLKFTPEICEMLHGICL